MISSICSTTYLDLAFQGIFTLSYISAENEHALEQKYEEMLNDTQDKRM
jgi:hypothetical protein